MSKWDIHINNHPRKGMTTTKSAVEFAGTTATMGDAPFVQVEAAKKFGVNRDNILAVPHRGSGKRGTSAISSDLEPLSLSQIKELGYSFWSKQETLESGQFDNLVYDDGKHRVWISRQTLADYDGDRKAFNADRWTVEKRTAGGAWKKAS